MFVAKFANRANRKLIFHLPLVNAALAVAVCLSRVIAADHPVAISGIYPQLAMYNDEGECGTGAVVPWAGRLWVITYAPHAPTGSSDKLYEITSDLQQTIRPESVGGTPANRMIHRESQQLFIGPYAIDVGGKVRVIPPSAMYGRLTGNARHLTDPANKIYVATMEEGIYEVDVKTLAVHELWADEQRKSGRHANLPGYHGKGLYSSQGRLVYANNGEHGPLALQRPEISSGVLAEWDGKDNTWSVVRRNQFTEVTGPGGIEGNLDPSMPIWSIGWDHRSLILMCLDGGVWQAYRLPKASHSYDGAHGWNTEWPRIREVNEDHLLMTMHGMFWKFPRTFSAKNSAGISPRSTYLKVVGDFCRWNDRIVLGCDDTAKNEFLNKRKAKGEIAAPQSQSNLWFLKPSELDDLGPVTGRGAVWLEDNVEAEVPSEPFLMSGFEQRTLLLQHRSETSATITIEVDDKGTGVWRKLRDVELPSHSALWIDFHDEPVGAWIRLISHRSLTSATAWFALRNPDHRSIKADARFDGLARDSETAMTGGVIRARAQNKRTLHFVATETSAGGIQQTGLYELDGQLQLNRVEDPEALAYQSKHAAIVPDVLLADAASAIFVDDQQRRWRIPRGSDSYDIQSPLGATRACREVATERDLFNAYGTFFELPAENAGGFAKIRAVATHNLRVHDYCSYRGLLVMSGVARSFPADNPHLIRSNDGRAALWVGAIDDIWKLGKPRGYGGPWKETRVEARVPSDPYLATGYDRKTMTLSHDAGSGVRFHIEYDLTGTGHWIPYRSFEVPAGESIRHEFPGALTMYWIRAVAETGCRATCQLVYE